MSFWSALTVSMRRFDVGGEFSSPDWNFFEVVNQNSKQK